MQGKVSESRIRKPDTSRPSSRRTVRATVWIGLLVVALDTLPASHAQQLFREAPNPEPVVLGDAWLVSPGMPPRRFSTIQAAYDAALEGDTIRLSDGLFRGQGNRNIKIMGRNVRIESINGPEQCVIDCERSGTAFDFMGPDITPDTILQDVTIVRAEAAVGGTGGGILVRLGATPLIQGCVLRDCHASFSGGGLAYIVLQPGPPGMIRDCVITECSSGDRGGGVTVTNATIDRCTITDNRVRTSGGGVYASGESTIRNSIIARNEDMGIGSASGGGILAEDVPTIIGCTVVENEAVIGSGIRTGQTSGALISNCIVWKNEGVSQIDTSFPIGVQTIIRHCNVEGGTLGIGGFPNPTPNVATILDVDPEFVDQQAGDYHLRPGSPMIDAGDPQFIPQPFSGDADAEPRSNGPVDIGGDEHWPGVAQALPVPRLAGGPNTLSARGARPGSLVVFWAGSIAGSLPLGPRSLPRPDAVDRRWHACWSRAGRRCGKCARAPFRSSLPVRDHDPSSGVHPRPLRPAPGLLGEQPRHCRIPLT